eukprot:2550241-Amphidinium_carterae.1
MNASHSAPLNHTYRLYRNDAQNDDKNKTHLSAVDHGSAATHILFLQSKRATGARTGAITPAVSPMFHDTKQGKDKRINVFDIPKQLSLQTIGECLRITARDRNDIFHAI